MRMTKFLLCAAVMLVAGLVPAPASAGTGQHEIINPAVAGAVDSASFPSTCYLEADDVTTGRSIFIDCQEFFAVDGDTISGNLTISGTTTLTGGLADGTTAVEIGRVADDSARINPITADTTFNCDTHGTGQLNYLSAGSGSVNIAVTLPAATGTGCRYWIGWSVAPNSASGQPGDVVQVTGNDSFNGNFLMAQDSANTAVYFETASDTDKLTFSSTQGAAVPWVFIEVGDVATDKWQILNSQLTGTGTEATPGATGQRS